ncbi:hypothetical protein ABIE44_001564 [Marmoricola sp. OAE513]|uniref:hypothetical protein n=1 Tax=Marmoricola sp. OAE513 TaxID=2817894 RepID=UPI003395DCEB
MQHAADAMGFSVRRMGWEIAWKPIVMLMVMIYGIGAGSVGYLWWQELRTIDNLPIAAMSSKSGTFVKVDGTVMNEPVYWPIGGEGRGHNNYSGAGVAVRMDDGSQVLLLAESLSVPDFKGDLDGLRVGDRVHAHGEVLKEVTGKQVEYYGWDAGDLPPAPDDGWILVRHSYP